MMICFNAATKSYNSISEETKTVEVHQGEFATSNVMTGNIYDNESTLWPINTILNCGDSVINGIDKKAFKEKYNCEN